MRVPFEWLKELVDVPGSPEETAHRLTMIGFEVEGTDRADNDVIFEVNVTPNRPDCLSIIGIARELSAYYGIPLKISPYHVRIEAPASDFSVEVLSPDLCNRYAGRVITGVKIAGTPAWISARLEQCGIRLINNIVDITNYVLLEFGHPLHAFDADTLKGRKVIVSTASAMKGQGYQAKMKTLDGVERDIPADSLLIWDAERPVAVAGVMGGAETEVTDRTENIFLESAYFEPASVRKTSRKLGLTSESSYRFERGTDIEFLEKALDRAALLIQEVAGGTLHTIIDIYPVKYVPEPVVVRYRRINQILGTDIRGKDMLRILTSLGFSTEEKGDEFLVYPPAYRHDIRKASDIAEEIARIYGYDNIPTTTPESPLSSGRLNRNLINLKKVREAMRKGGFTEVINYSFMSMAALDLISVADNDRKRKTMAISNPLSQDGCLLRTTLIPALLANLKYNLDRGIKDIRLFEIARVFEDTGSALPFEELRLGGVFFRDRFPAFWKEDAQDFFITKGVIEALFHELRITRYRFAPSSEPILHPGQSADIFLHDTCIGHIGVLAPGIVEKLDLRRHKPDIVLFEINLDLFLRFVPESMIYSDIPKYPSVERDIALIIQDKIPAATIQDLIRAYPSEFIVEVSLFDHFKGGNIPQGKKSLAFNIIYRSKERTLTDQEVEVLHSSLVAYLIEKTGAELRG